MRKKGYGSKPDTCLSRDQKKSRGGGKEIVVYKRAQIFKELFFVFCFFFPENVATVALGNNDKQDKVRKVSWCIISYIHTVAMSTCTAGQVGRTSGKGFVNVPRLPEREMEGFLMVDFQLTTYPFPDAHT